MKDTESYVNKAELKRKVRAWLRYNQSSKQVTDELLSLIEKLPVMVKGQLETTLESEWVSVKDRLPDEDEKVLTYGANGVTHWMPLPPPPISEDNTDA